MKLKHAFVISLFIALLMESTYEFMSRNEAWLIGLGLGAIAGLFIYGVTRSSRNQ